MYMIIEYLDLQGYGIQPAPSEYNLAAYFKSQHSTENVGVKQPV